MALNRRAAWLTISIAAPYIVDVQSLTTLFGVVADTRLLSGFFDAGFLQSLQWLRAMKLLTELLLAGTATSGSAAAIRRDNMFEYLEPLTIGLIPTLIVIDWAIRGRKHDSTRFWRIRATAVAAAVFYIAGYVAVFWGTVFGDFHLVDGSSLGTWGGALVGILVYELGHYWYHRSAHQFDWLWRAGHQMHHSAESLDAFGAYWMHPVDAALFTTIASFVFFPFLGLTLEAGLLGGLFLTFNAMFQHMSFRTPRWLGYIIQRPESHSVHHGKNIHRYNYSDLPLWDIVFGTFRNPESFQKEHGFYPGSSERVVEMLTFRDVTSPKRRK
ncbi:MAG TPA: sterol desaturase family protein, partial [Woeseiaceae bacterium]|nr:sterol desaturase family protein [Woeseiaceae bacterium]